MGLPLGYRLGSTPQGRDNFQRAVLRKAIRALINGKHTIRRVRLPARMSELAYNTLSH